MMKGISSGFLLRLDFVRFFRIKAAVLLNAVAFTMEKIKHD